MITTEEIDNIKKQFREVVTYSQGIEDPKVDDLFAEWLEAKRDFIEAINGELIFEYPETVYFDLNKNDKMRRIEDFQDLIAGQYQNDALVDFITIQKEGFFSNRVVIPFTAPDGTKVSEGMKLLKAFKFFEKDKNALDAIQTAASMIIQEDKIEGKVCLSVHPLDFLSVSENNHNWRSCHALDGEYRAGNLSYMKDKCTIICYLKSKENEKLNNFPESVKWNSKKWRVLLYFSEKWDLLFAGRQYPFSSDTGINFIREKLLPAAGMHTWSEWTSKKITEFNNGIKTFYYPSSSAYIPYGDGMAKMNEIVKNNSGSLQFNDLLSSSCYDPMYCFRTRKSSTDIWLKQFFGSLYPEEEGTEKENERMMISECRDVPHIRVGGAVKCLRCGKKDIELTESMMCNDCESEYGEADSDIFGTCPCCGSRFVFDEGTYVEGSDEIICPDCADNNTTFCANCGGVFYNDQVLYDRITESYYCKDCFVDCECELEEDID